MSNPEWIMPPETAAQERIWMAFPPNVPNSGESPAEIDAARQSWAAVANAIVNFEPVTMVVDPADSEVVGNYLDSRVDITHTPLDDAWMRDIGPTFVTNPDGTELGAVLWDFNGWGQQDWARWGKDSQVNAFVAEQAGAQLIRPGIVNEGGGFQIDEHGTVLLTESVQLDPKRNPGATRETIEKAIHAHLGTSKAVWLNRGLYRDGLRYGTRGHVDIVAALPGTGTLLVHEQQNPEHPDHQFSAEVINRLASETNANGEQFKIIPVPAPRKLRDETDFVDYSYINHVVINGAVIACTFDDPADEPAISILAQAYPGRTVIGVDAREIFARGGGIHCITQQQPALARG